MIGRSKSGAAALALLAVAALTAACTSGAGSTRAKRSTTVEFWVGWTGAEFTALRGVLDSFEKSHPGVRVHAVPDQGDPEKVALAVSAGNGPDLATAFGTDRLGKLCSSGVLADLTSFERSASVRTDVFPTAIDKAVTFGGKRCALPFMADTFGLYYNRKLLADAGYTAPPKDVDQLAEMAIRSTKYNADGSIKIAGFVPLFGFGQSYATRYAAWFGAQYFDADGKATLSRDPAWERLFRFQKRIIDAVGYDKLKRFAATAGDEFSPANPFERGTVAMSLDGEWRTSFIEREHPGLSYGTEGLPAPVGQPELAGASEIGITLLGIPRNAKHRDAAWELARYLAVDTAPLVRFASAIHNVPTTRAALKSPALAAGPQFAPFVAALGNPRSAVPAVLAGGPVYFDPISEFMQKWQAGKVGDLHAGLVHLDGLIDKLVAQS